MKRFFRVTVFVIALFLIVHRASAATVTTCAQYQAVTVGSYIIQTDYWNQTHCPGTQCMNVDDQTGAFTVTKGDYVCDNPYIVATYPSIVYGYAFGTRSPNSDLPAQISSLKSVKTSWSFQPTNTGRWDAAYDIWICPDNHCGPGGFDGGIEVMIWLDYMNTNGWKTDLGSATIDGKDWEVWFCDANASGSKWGYIAYLAKTMVTSVKDLDIKKFLDDGEKRGYIQPTWYLSAVEAGNEIHSGGIPFMSKSFSVSVTKEGGNGKPKSAYKYRVPQSLSDGWKVEKLQKMKMDAKTITLGVQAILDGTLPDIRSLMVLRHGRLLLDEYFGGFSVNDRMPLYSETKSVFSTVYGIAQDKGLLDVDQKVADLYPDARKNPGWDSRKDDITVGMLLSMTSGFDCDDAGVWDSHACNAAMVQSADWPAYCLSLPISHPPGQTWTYNGTCLTILSNLIAQKCGMSFQEFSDKNLFGVLGIQGSVWKMGPNGVAKVDEGLSWTPRDMAKLGQLYLDKGMWNGKRVVSQKWVESATTPQAPQRQAWGHDYGYLWHVQTMHRGGETIQVFYANGYNGQDIFVVPQDDLVCVMTGGNNDLNMGMEVEFFEKWILAAAR